MGFYRGPQLVSDNLYYALDFGSAISTAGTTFNSLIGKWPTPIAKGSGVISNGALQMDETYGYAINTQDHPLWDDNVDVSWETFFTTNAPATRQSIFGHKLNISNSFYANGGIILSGSKINAEWYDNSVYWAEPGTGPTVVSGEWYHAVLTFTNSDLKFRLYVNGVLVYTSAATNNNYGDATAGSKYTCIGNNYRSGAYYYLNGQIMAVRQYINKSLTLQEVINNYNFYLKRI